MLHWIREHQVLLYWLTGVSVLLFIASLIIVPLLILRIPPDYFAHDTRPAGTWAHRHRLLRLALLLAKNAAGYLFIAAGLAMLVLPGQGLLTILIGFLLIDFPGKYRAEQWLISRRRILSTINWFRTRRARPPLTTAPGPPT